MKRGDRIHIWWIRYSDGTIAVCSESYEAAVKMAEERIKETDLTCTIIE